MSDGDLASIAKEFENMIFPIEGESTHSHDIDCEVSKYSGLFRRLSFLLEALGGAFTFVKRDIEKKIDIIDSNKNKLMKKNVNESKYLLATIVWEKDMNLLNNTSSTGKNTLKLLRALKFISILMNELNDKDASTINAARYAYSNSLSKYHSWGIRKTISIAMYSLPDRKEFLKRLSLDASADNVFEPFVRTIDNIYQPLNDFYEKENLLDLT